MLGKKAGFSFLEIVVALLIMAVVAAVAVPNLLRRDPKQQRQLFVRQLDEVLQKASTQALLTGVIQKVILTTATKQLTVVPEQPASDSQDKQKATPIAHLSWPDNLEIEQFYIQGVDEFAAKNSGKQTDELWFYIIPDAMAQEVIINGKDTKDIRALDTLAQWSVVLNPFTLRFTLYEEFQTPSF